VIYADAHVIVVAKPAGLSTVPYEAESGPKGMAKEDTLEARVRAWIERHAAAGRPGRPNLGIVHRLDKETTGLIVFTRTWLAKKSLSAQFRRHSVHRRYLAIAHGEVRPQTMRSVLVADRGDGLRGSSTRAQHGRVAGAGAPDGRVAGAGAPDGRVAGAGAPDGRVAGAGAPDGRVAGAGAPDGRVAVTHVEPLEALRGATLVACRLETGRTHQIRIHLSEAGHPIVGERVYIRRYAGPLLEAPRLMLHAAELGFVHPATERAMHWELPPPDDMRAVLERLRTQE
jgi:23S rRNA pseudouridine1911/1915/1917 synthase